MVYLRAEVDRLFKCSLGNIERNIDMYDSVNDLYTGFMINSRAKHYGLEQDKEFEKVIIDKLDSKWVRNFNAENFVLSDGNNMNSGVTIENLKLVEMLSYFASDSSIADAA